MYDQNGVYREKAESVGFRKCGSFLVLKVLVLYQSYWLSKSGYFEDFRHIALLLALNETISHKCPLDGAAVA